MVELAALLLLSVAQEMPAATPAQELADLTPAVVEAIRDDLRGYSSRDIATGPIFLDIAKYKSAAQNGLGATADDVGASWSGRTGNRLDVYEGDYRALLAGTFDRRNAKGIWIKENGVHLEIEAVERTSKGIAVTAHYRYSAHANSLLSCATVRYKFERQHVLGEGKPQLVLVAREGLLVC